MIEILICGAGNIGRVIAGLLAGSDDYYIHLADIDFSSSALDSLLNQQSNIKTVALDVRDESSSIQYVSQYNIKAVISCLPSELNPHVAMLAREMSLHYFDLGENVEIVRKIENIAKGACSAFVPNCGLVPGMVGMITNEIVRSFDNCYAAHIRVGALLQNPVNYLDYSPDCSIDRIINQYTNKCMVINEGVIQTVDALEDQECCEIDGTIFEAFNASGCTGGLPEILKNTIQELDYKSLHFKGHCERIKFLLQDLNLQNNPRLLREILSQAALSPQADQVLINITVNGMSNGKILEQRYNKILLPTTINTMEMSATQASTAAGLCAVFDHVIKHPEEFHGLIVRKHFLQQQYLQIDLLLITVELYTARDHNLWFFDSAIFVLVCILKLGNRITIKQHFKIQIRTKRTRQKPKIVSTHSTDIIKH